MSAPSVLLLASCTGAVCAACSTAPSAPALPQRPTTAELPRIVQFDYGSHTRFGTCIEPACPVVTRKSVAPARTVQSPLPRLSEPARPAATVPAPALTSRSGG